MRGLLFLSALPLAGFSNAELASVEQEPVKQEPRYYTWVDAQGIMHNTLITPQKTSQKTPQPTTKAVFDQDEFPSEEAYQQNQKDQLEAQKPFFTWTDAQGIIRSEVKPDVIVDFVAEEIVYDAVFAPPFRLPSYVMEGKCCENYADAFSAVAEFNGSASYLVDETLFPFQTQSGNVAAAYFVLPELSAKEIILLKAYKLPEQSSFEVIALDKAFQPLYLGSELDGLFVEQTWKDLAYKQLMLEISDTEVAYLVVFMRSNVASSGKSALTDYRVSVMRDQLLD